MAFAEFLIAALIMELTPGPNMAWLALLAARQGRGAGMAAVAGIAVGLALLAVAATFGVATLIATYPVIYEALRWGGVAFLLYLAFETWRGERPGASDGQDSTRQFRRGLIVNLLNPKAATVFIVLIPAFAGASPGIDRIMLMSAIYLVIATLAHMAIVLFAANFQRALADPRRELWVRRAFALTLAAIAIWFAFTTGRAS